MRDALLVGRAQQLRQLGENGGDPLRLLARQQLHTTISRLNPDNYWAILLGSLRST